MQVLFLVCLLAGMAAARVAEPVQGESLECWGCKETMKLFVDFLAKDPSKTKLLEDALLKVCDVIPDPDDRAICQQVVKESVIDFIEKMVKDPENAPGFICHALKVCKSESSALKIMDVAAATPNPQLCAVCHSVFTFVIEAIQNQDLENVMQKYFEQACDNLPVVSSRQRCKDLLNHFWQDILNAIKGFLDPLWLCAAIGACPA